MQSKQVKTVLILLPCTVVVCITLPCTVVPELLLPLRGTVFESLLVVQPFISERDSFFAFCFRLLPEPLARNLDLRIVCNIRIEQTHVQHDENHRVFAANQA